MDAMRETNREFYDGLWRDAELSAPERFNTWATVSSMLDRGACLEVGPGLRPRLPLDRSWFLEASPPAVRKLRAAGARALVGDVCDLPFATGAFSLVAAFDLVEHVADDARVFRELARVLGKGGALLLSIPIHATWWTPFDDLVGHYRRYEPAALLALLGAHGFALEQSATFGMAPRSWWIQRFAMWVLRSYRERAMWWYNRVFLPIGIYSKRSLRFAPGLHAPEGVDEIVVVCRRL